MEKETIYNDIDKITTPLIEDANIFIDDYLVLDGLKIRINGQITEYILKLLEGGKS